MMNNGISAKQRSIVLIPFPFSDLSTVKKRPALIISDDHYNQKNEDIICCALTSNPREYAYSIQINEEDLEQGKLLFESRAKPTKVFTLDKKRIIKSLGKLTFVKSQEAVNQLKQIITVK